MIFLDPVGFYRSGVVLIVRLVPRKVGYSGHVFETPMVKNTFA
jgi:hypothetical protein